MVWRGEAGLLQLKNREGFSQFDCEPDQTEGRTPGLSALIRLCDEEAWIGQCLESCINWFDEIIICLNLCSDRTPELVEQWRKVHQSKIKVFDYPFKIHEMGPMHNKCPADSVHSSAYYYNYCQAQSTKMLVCKVDGDLVFLDWAGPAIRALIDQGHDRIRFEGRDIVGDDVAHIGSHPLCRTNGVYPVRPGTRYEQGPVTQNLKGVQDADDAFDNEPAFVHMKWCRKSEQSATTQWPENWREIPHFQRIYERRVPVAPYTGEYPSSMRQFAQ